MKENEIKLLERLEKVDADSFQNIMDVIKIHVVFTEKLNMLLDSIPKLIANMTGEDENRDIIPDIMACDSPDEVCKVINEWMKNEG